MMHHPTIRLNDIDPNSPAYRNAITAGQVRVLREAIRQYHTGREWETETYSTLGGPGETEDLCSVTGSARDAAEKRLIQAILCLDPPPVYQGRKLMAVADDRARAVVYAGRMYVVASSTDGNNPSKFSDCEWILSVVALADVVSLTNDSGPVPVEGRLCP
jgi:hypothetical protein